MRRQRRWLVLALALFALGAVLMFWGQGDEEQPSAPRVEFPRRLREREVERMTARRTQAAQATATAPARPRVPRDPLLAALPRGKGRTALVFEANALRHSPVGELLLDCLLRDGGSNLAQLKQRTGVDPLQDLDRLVVTDDGVILSGNFGEARMAELFEETDSREYGEGARLYAPRLPASPSTADGAERSSPSLASWNDQLLVFSRDPDGAREVIDRVEGRAGADEAPLIDEESTYGEMYGVVGVAQLQQMLGRDQPELLARLGEVAESVELHIDARSDVALVAEVKGADADKVKDLGKSLGAALSVARLQAQAEGQQELVQLLDFARVRPDDGTFRLEVALPLPYLQEKLAACGEARSAAEAAAHDAGVESL